MSSERLFIFTTPASLHILLWESGCESSTSTASRRIPFRATDATVPFTGMGAAREAASRYKQPIMVLVNGTSQLSALSKSSSQIKAGALTSLLHKGYLQGFLQGFPLLLLKVMLRKGLPYLCSCSHLMCLASDGQTETPPRSPHNCSRAPKASKGMEVLASIGPGRSKAVHLRQSLYLSSGHPPT